MGVAGITYFIAGDGKSLRTRKDNITAYPNGSMLRPRTPGSGALLVKVVVCDEPAVIATTKVYAGRRSSCGKIIIHVVVGNGIAAITNRGIAGRS